MKTHYFFANKMFLGALIFCASFLILGTQAQAANIAFNFPISGTQEVPANASTGTGSCSVTLDDVSGAVSVSCTFSGLADNATASHIHGLAAAGVNAGVIIPLTPSLATSGTITGNGVLTAPQIAGMIDEMTYVNLHSAAFPGGELRGQVVQEAAASRAIPTLGNSFLAVLAMLLLLAGVVALRRRVN